MSGAVEGLPAAVEAAVEQAFRLAREGRHDAALELLKPFWSDDPDVKHPAIALAGAKLGVLQAISEAAAVAGEEPEQREAKLLARLHRALFACCTGALNHGSAQCLRLAITLFELCMGRPGGEFRAGMARMLQAKYPTVRKLLQDPRFVDPQLPEMEAVPSVRWPFEWRDPRGAGGQLTAQHYFLRLVGQVYEATLDRVTFLDSPSQPGRPAHFQADRELLQHLRRRADERLVQPGMDRLVPAEELAALRALLHPSSTAGGSAVSTAQAPAAAAGQQEAREAAEQRRPARSPAELRAAKTRAQKLQKWLLSKMQAAEGPAEAQWHSVLAMLDTPAAEVEAEARRLAAEGTISEQEAVSVLSALQRARQGHAFWCAVPEGRELDSISSGGGSDSTCGADGGGVGDGWTEAAEMAAAVLRAGRPFGRHPRLAGFLDMLLGHKPMMELLARSRDKDVRGSGLLASRAEPFVRISLHAGHECMRIMDLERMMSPAASDDRPAAGSAEPADRHIRLPDSVLPPRGSEAAFTAAGCTLASPLLPQVASEMLGLVSLGASGGAADAGPSSEAQRGAAGRQPALGKVDMAQVAAAAEAGEQARPLSILPCRDAADTTVHPLTCYVAQQCAAQAYLEGLTDSPKAEASGWDEEEGELSLGSISASFATPGDRAAEHRRMVAAMVRGAVLGWTALCSAQDDGEAQQGGSSDTASDREGYFAGGEGADEEAPQQGVSQARLEQLSPVWAQWAEMKACRSAEEVLEMAGTLMQRYDQASAETLAMLLASPEAGFSPVEDLPALACLFLQPFSGGEQADEEGVRRLRETVAIGLLLAGLASEPGGGLKPGLAGNAVLEFMRRCLPQELTEPGPPDLDRLEALLARLPPPRLLQLAVFVSLHAASAVHSAALLQPDFALLAILEPVRLEGENMLGLTTDAVLAFERAASMQRPSQPRQHERGSEADQPQGHMRPLVASAGGQKADARQQRANAACLAHMACGLPLPGSHQQAGEAPGHLLLAGQKDAPARRWQRLVRRLQQLCFVESSLQPQLEMEESLRRAARWTAGELAWLKHDLEGLSADPVKAVVAMREGCTPSQLGKSVESICQTVRLLLLSHYTHSVGLAKTEVSLRLAQREFELSWLDARLASLTKQLKASRSQRSLAEQQIVLLERADRVEKQARVLHSMLAALTLCEHDVLHRLVEGPGMAPAAARGEETRGLAEAFGRCAALARTAHLLKRCDTWDLQTMEVVQQRMAAVADALFDLRVDGRALASLQTVAEAAHTAKQRLLGRLLLEHCTRPTLEPVFELMMRHLAAPRWERAMQQEEEAAEAAAEAAERALLEAEEQEAGKAKQKSGSSKKKGKKGRKQQQQAAAARPVPALEQQEEEGEEEGEEGAPTPQQQSERRQEEAESPPSPLPEEGEGQRQAAAVIAQAPGEEQGEEEEGSGEGQQVSSTPADKGGGQASEQGRGGQETDEAEQRQQQQEGQQEGEAVPGASPSPASTPPATAAVRPALSEPGPSAEQQKQGQRRGPVQAQPQQKRAGRQQRAGKQPGEEQQAGGGQKTGKQRRKKGGQVAAAQAAAAGASGPAEARQAVPPPAPDEQPQAAVPVTPTDEEQEDEVEAGLDEWQQWQELQLQQRKREEEWQASKGRRGRQGRQGRGQQPGQAPQPAVTPPPPALRPAAGPAASQSAGRAASVHQPPLQPQASSPAQQPAAEPKPEGEPPAAGQLACRVWQQPTSQVPANAAQPSRPTQQAQQAQQAGRPKPVWQRAGGGEGTLLVKTSTPAPAPQPEPALADRPQAEPHSADAEAAPPALAAPAAGSLGQPGSSSQASSSAQLAFLAQHGSQAGGDDEGDEEDLEDMLGMLGVPAGSTAGSTVASASAVSAFTAWGATPQHGFPGAPAGSLAAASAGSLWGPPGSIPGLVATPLPPSMPPAAAASPAAFSPRPSRGVRPPAPASWAQRAQATADEEGSGPGLEGWPGLGPAREEDEEAEQLQAAIAASLADAAADARTVSQLSRLAAAASTAAGGSEAAADGLALPGLRNEAGEYNCFLNVIVQCLWRCTEFRQQVLSWSEAVTCQNRVVASLHDLFVALHQAAAAGGGPAAGGGGAPVAVNPSELREALAALPNQLFALGEMSDAGETLLTMFEKIREAGASTAAILDLLFGLKVREAATCPHCGKVTHRQAYTQYFYNTRASALRRVVAQAVEERRRGIIGAKTLGGRLRKIEEQVHKSCDTDHGGCNKSVPVNTRLEAAPRVFSLQVAWLSNQESPQAVGETLAALDETVDLAELYQDAPLGSRRYRLRSMVCYYGQHYQALVLVPDAGGWLMFDDTRVTRVGAWADVKRKCEAGRVQPSVLFFEAVAGGGGRQ